MAGQGQRWGTAEQGREYDLSRGDLERWRKTEQAALQQYSARDGIGRVGDGADPTYGPWRSTGKATGFLPDLANPILLTRVLSLFIRGSALRLVQSDPQYLHTGVLRTPSSVICCSLSELKSPHSGQ